MIQKGKKKLKWVQKLREKRRNKTKKTTPGK